MDEIVLFLHVIILFFKSSWFKIASASNQLNSVYVTPLKDANRLAPTEGGTGGAWSQLVQQLKPFLDDPSSSPRGAFTIL